MLNKSVHILMVLLQFAFNILVNLSSWIIISFLMAHSVFLLL